MRIRTQCEHSSPACPVCLDEIELRQREGTLSPRDGKDLAIRGGIATEKALLAAGQPTEIVANVHAHRHEIGPLMDRLAQAARVLSVRKGDSA